MSGGKYYFFIGTTAEFIKLAPIIKEFKQRNLPFKILTSGQNNVNFSELTFFTGKLSVYYAFTMRPITLNLHPIIKFIIWVAKAFVNYILFFSHEFKTKNKKNIYFIVHGDTISSFLGAIIAKLFRVKVIHIESGLRSFNFLEPFPEEICRYVVSRLADIHFCPNAWSVNNLTNTRGEKVNTYENTLIEAYWYVANKKVKNNFLIQIRRKSKTFCVFVMHRQEHVIFGISKSRELAESILHQIPKSMSCVFIIHDLSVNFFRSLESVIPDEIKKRIIKSHRLPYTDFIHLLSGAEFVVTDGGSNQEEMYYMGKPCLLIRRRTERIEGIGENVIISKNEQETIKLFFSKYYDMKRKPIFFRNKPSKIIVDYLSNYEG